MSIEQLRAAHQAQPFRPFVIHLADGRSVPVHHPEFILTAPSARTVVVAQRDETFHIIDLPLVTGLEFNPKGNGSARRRKS
jgi:hypothetical protein